MKKILMFTWGLVATGLLTLWVLAHDLRMWWAWRREGNTARVVRHKRTVPGYVAA
jgi:hypothetical protein